MRTPEEVFADFAARRRGILRALGPEYVSVGSEEEEEEERTKKKHHLAVEWFFFLLFPSSTSMTFLVPR